MNDIIDQIIETFDNFGDKLYEGGEQVTQRQHALQTAYFIQKNSNSKNLIAAALLHDYGHLLPDFSEELPIQSTEGKHEEIGAAYLEHYFVQPVTEPGRLHVAAKRYLCATNPNYLKTLSPVSVRSLQLQGGPFSQEEVEEFDLLPYSEDAIHLRRCDEMGKDPKLQTPDLDHYLPYLEAGLKENIQDE